MPIWLSITLAVASLVIGLAGPVNTWTMFRRSDKTTTTDVNHLRNASQSVPGRIIKFLISVYTLSITSIIYNLWYAVHLVHGQNGITVTFIVMFGITIAIICFELMLILLQFSTDLIDKRINGILDVLPQLLALIAATFDQVRILIEHSSSSLQVIGGVQTSVVEIIKTQKKAAKIMTDLVEFQTARDGEANAQHKLDTCNGAI